MTSSTSRSPAKRPGSVLEAENDQKNPRISYDEDDYFGKFIVEKMKTFPKKLKNKVKSHIFEYIMEIDNSID